MGIEPTSLFAGLERYSPLVQRMLAGVRETKIPFGGSIELTHRCNLACTHCYVNLPAADRHAQQREMTTEQLKRILDELVELGTLELTFTGGEPLLRPDFAEIYTHAHHAGILLSVYSNATLITDRVVELFQECPPRTVDVTIYGDSAETYDRVANVGAGQHARYRRGIEKLAKAGIEYSLKTVAIRSNAHEIDAIYAFARSLGKELRLDGIISPRIDGGRGPLAERLPAAQVSALEQIDPARAKLFADYCSPHMGGISDSDALYECGAGLGTFLIDPYGKLHLCELSRTLGFDVLKHGFAKGWYEAVPAKRDQKRVTSDGCGSCGVHGACSNCVGMAELEGLIPGDGNPYLCEVTDERAGLLMGPDRPLPRGLVRLGLKRPTHATG